MAEITTIARPYAKAAFEFALESSELDKWAEMLSFSAQIVQDSQIASLIESERPTTVVEVIAAVCQEQLSEQGLNLIKLMAENERLEALPNVLALYLEFKADHDRIITAEVISASELDAQQLEQITASLEQRLERKVKLDCSVDPSIVAGFIIRAGDLVIDSSVQGQLAKLADTLQA